MSSRSFKVFETKKYLESIFNEFWKNNVIKYYKCDKSYINKWQILLKLITLFFSFNGCHIGNEYFVIKDNEIV